MKKLLSVLIAATMMCTAFVTSHAAALDANYAVSARPFSAEENEMFADVLAGGLKGYVVELDITTAAELTHTKDALNRVSGRKLSVVQLDLVADDKANIALAACMNSALADVENLTASAEFDAENKFTVAFSAAGAGAAYPKSGTTTTVDNAYQIFVFTTGDVTLTPYVTATVTTYKTNSAVAGSEETVNNAACAPVKLATEQPKPEVAVTTGAGVAVTGVADRDGKVWNNVVIENVALGTNYRAQFSIGDDKSEELAIEGIEAETNGSTTFAVVLKTAKDVADIVLDILYDKVQ